MNFIYWRPWFEPGYCMNPQIQLKALKTKSIELGIASEHCQLFPPSPKVMFLENILGKLILWEPYLVIIQGYSQVCVLRLLSEVLEIESRLAVCKVPSYNELSFHR